MLPPSAMPEAITMATREQRLRDHYLTEQPWIEPRTERRRKPWMGMRFGRRILNGMSTLVATRFFARRRPANPQVIAKGIGQ